MFDLDDTLYPYRAFVKSGLAVVAGRLAQRHGVPVSRVRRAVRHALVDGVHGRELQALCGALSLPSAMVPQLVDVIREHKPALQLPAASRRVLARMRRGWKVAILTNGVPRIQRRKVAALGVRKLVDAVVFAAECGDGAGKPDAAAFRSALLRLKVKADAAVFVGDDPRADIAGAAAVGMKAIHMVAYRRGGANCAPCRGAHVRRLEQVPRVADRLVPARNERHVF